MLKPDLLFFILDPKFFNHAALNLKAGKIVFEFTDDAHVGDYVLTFKNDAYDFIKIESKMDPSAINILGVFRSVVDQLLPP